jgi:uncharacterized protein involved in response to NO
MIYTVAARALPAFLGRRLWSTPLQAATLAVANLGVALRVVPQLAAGTDPLSDALIGLSGILAYVALALFTLNVIRTLREPRTPAIDAGAPQPIEFRLSRGR